MTKTALALVSAVLVSGWVLAPAEALAGGRHGRSHGHGFHGKSLHSTPPKFFPKHHHHHHHGFRHRHGFGVGIIAPPVVIYSAPSYVPEYVPPPPAYTPTYVPPPAYSYAPPPMQRVVEFATGRYELHGDGVTTAYRWVWIPNPPTSPPVEEPPVAPPPGPPAEAPAPAPVERTRRADIYRWTDDAGVVHITDRLEKVPETYRSKVTKTQS